jgi:hypothetical protein
VREYRPPGSVRGACGDTRPYRDTYAMARTIAGRHREAITASKAQARLVMATLAANPERLEYLEAIRMASYAAVHKA